MSIVKKEEALEVLINLVETDILNSRINKVLNDIIFNLKLDEQPLAWGASDEELEHINSF